MTRLVTIGIALAVLGGAACKDKPKEAGGDGKGTGTGAAATHTFQWKPPAAGQTAEQVGTTTMRLVVTPPGEEPTPGELRQETTKAFTIVEVDGDLVRKVDVRYEAARRTQRFGDDTAGGETAIHGKRYVVSLDGDAFRATTPDGGEVSPAELELLADDWRDSMGRIPPMARIVANRAWTLGAPVELSPEELAILSEGRETVARSATLTLREVGGGIATFEAELQVEIRRPGGATRMPARLTAKVDTERSRPLDIVMTASFEDDSGGTRTTGTMEGRETTTWK